MIMTVLEAHVPQEEWPALIDKFSSGNDHMPRQMLETLLVQDTQDRTLWRVISTWRSREALGEYRRSVETPEGVLFFRAVGAEPAVSILDVASQAQQV